MSPGSQIRALTAKRAIPKIATIKIGKTLDRKNPNFQMQFFLFCSFNGQMKINYKKLDH